MSRATSNGQFMGIQAGSLTLQEARERMLRERLEVLELEAAARKRLPGLSRNIEFQIGRYQFGENGHVFENCEKENEVLHGHLAYLRDEKILKVWRGYLRS